MREVFSRGWKLLPVSRRGLERFVRWLQAPSPDINILQSTQRTTEPEPEMFLPTPGSGPGMRDAEMCNGLNIVQSTQPGAHTQRQETRAEPLVRDPEMGFSREWKQTSITIRVACANLITSTGPRAPSPTASLAPSELIVTGPNMIAL